MQKQNAYEVLQWKTSYFDYLTLYQNLYIYFIITGITINTISSSVYQGFARSLVKGKMSLIFSICIP